MRARLLNGLAVAARDTLRRSLLTFTEDERQRYVDAWARVDKHQRAPQTLTREELNCYHEDVELLTKCASCGSRATGSTHLPEDEAFEIPVCLQCLENPAEGE